MESCFRPTLIDSVQDQPSCSCLKVYARIAGCVGSDPSLLLVDDGSSKLLVDTSGLDSPIYEKGEWYRFLGEYKGLADRSVPSLPCLRLLVPPRQIERFDREQYGNMISMLDNFQSDFDCLVAYATRNR
jgi:hypothetical protein